MQSASDLKNLMGSINKMKSLSQKYLSHVKLTL